MFYKIKQSKFCQQTVHMFCGMLNRRSSRAAAADSASRTLARNVSIVLLALAMSTLIRVVDAANSGDGSIVNANSRITGAVSPVHGVESARQEQGMLGKRRLQGDSQTHPHGNFKN